MLLLYVLDFRAKIESGEVDLSTLAKTESDCSSASRGGDLGKFGYGQMQGNGITKNTLIQCQYSHICIKTIGNKASFEQAA